MGAIKDWFRSLFRDEDVKGLVPLPEDYLREFEVKFAATEEEEWE